MDFNEKGREVCYLTILSTAKITEHQISLSMILDLFLMVPSKYKIQVPRQLSILAFTCQVPAVSWSTIQSKCPLWDDVLSFKQDEHIFNGALSC